MVVSGKHSPQAPRWTRTTSFHMQNALTRPQVPWECHLSLKTRVSLSPPCTRAGQAGRRRWQEAPGAALSGLLQEPRKAAHACMGCFRQPAPSPQEPGGPGPFVPAAPTPSSPSRHTTSLQTQAALGAPTDEALGHTAAPPGSRPLCPPPKDRPAASAHCPPGRPVPQQRPPGTGLALPPAHSPLFIHRPLAWRRGRE